MKTSTLERNGVPTEMVDLIGRLIDLITWPTRRRAMGDVPMTLLDGKRRVVEDVFGWNRRAVELGIHKYQTGIACVFENVRRVNALADADEHTLRISIDTKATVHVGDYSRGGRWRGVEAVKALDHDMCMKEKLVPVGILEPIGGKS